MEVEVYNGAGEEYTIDGDFSQRSCVIYDTEKRTMAEIKRKVDASTNVMLGRDVFTLEIKPGFDGAFAMGLFVVLDQINGDDPVEIGDEQSQPLEMVLGFLRSGSGFLEPAAGRVWRGGAHPLDRPRFEYKAATGAFTPDRVAVYCKCEMPYNPDALMVQCEGCKDWYHPACVGMTIEEAKKLEHFVCAECSSDENGIKRSQNGFASSPTNDLKQLVFHVEAKRRKR